MLFSGRRDGNHEEKTMTQPTRFSAATLLGGAVVALAIVIGVIAWLSIDPSGEQGSGLPESFDYSLESYQKIDPALIHYVQKTTIPLDMHEPRAVAVGLGDRIFAAGDKAIHIFDSDGKKLEHIALEQEPYCLAVAGVERLAADTRLYVGMKDHVEVYDGKGRRLRVWNRPSARAVLTSIAVTDMDVFVADAGSPVVWRYDFDGNVLGRIGRRDREREIPGFIVPSPYFDLAMAPDGLLRVVNPGMHRIEAYTVDGHLELFWGRPGMGIETFCGCCNPANIAILDDGRVVTAEKGIPRVKVYRATGEFESVVVGPETLARHSSATVETRDEHRLCPVDLAVDRRSRILVLDSAADCVRVY